MPEYFSRDASRARDGVSSKNIPLGPRVIGGGWMANGCGSKSLCDPEGTPIDSSPSVRFDKGQRWVARLRESLP